VGDVRYDGLAAAPSFAYYLPLRQELWTGGYVALRTEADPQLLVPSVRRTVSLVDPDLPLRDIHTLDELMADAIAQPRFRTILAAGFGLLGVLLAAFGIYGVVSFSTALRLQEFGVRLALGARASHLVALVLREGATLAVFGLVVGLAGAWGSARLLRRFLYGVGPSDPVTFVALAALFGLVTILACLAPARRALRVDPVVALRAD
jgi:putative ABC transport system permease protein